MFTYIDNYGLTGMIPCNEGESSVSNNPTCKACGASGHGVLFSIFSKYGFGTYCVPCEQRIDSAKGGK